MPARKRRRSRRPLGAPTPMPPPDPRWEAYLGPEHTATWYAKLEGRPPLPPELDWMRNPDAPLPPGGYVWVVCLCGWAFPARRPGFHGQVRDREYVITATVGPSVTAGDPCPVCQAPYRRVDRPGDPYPWPFELIDPDEGRPGYVPTRSGRPLLRVLPGGQIPRVGSSGDATTKEA